MLGNPFSFQVTMSTSTPLEKLLKTVQKHESKIKGLFFSFQVIMSTSITRSPFAQLNRRISALVQGQKDSCLNQLGIHLDQNCQYLDSWMSIICRYLKANYIIGGLEKNETKLTC